MTTTPTPAPPASPERPDLATVETKADITERLKTLAKLLPWFGLVEAEHTQIVADAITTIQALREMNQRHCDDERLLKEARARVAELERKLGGSDGA